MYKLLNAILLSFEHCECRRRSKREVTQAILSAGRGQTAVFISAHQQIPDGFTSLWLQLFSKCAQMIQMMVKKHISAMRQHLGHVTMMLHVTARH